MFNLSYVYVYEFINTNNLHLNMLHILKIKNDKLEIVYCKEVASQASETQLHRFMEFYRVKMTRELFDCPLQKIIEYIEML